MDDSGRMIEGIVDGHADDNLEGIINAARQRQKAVAFRTAAQLKRGDKVRICGNISPKYLLGAEGTIDGPVRGERIPFKFDEPTGRFSGTVQVPIGCLEPA